MELTAKCVYFCKLGLFRHFSTHTNLYSEIALQPVSRFYVFLSRMKRYCDQQQLLHRIRGTCPVDVFRADAVA